jgi:sulfate/thiosulfate transport system permease protein
VSRRRALPGFGLSLGISAAYVSLLVLLPLLGVVAHGLGLGPAKIWALCAEPRAAAALLLTFGGAAIAAVIDTVFGALVAWVIVRYRFPGRRALDVLVDVPFALPTAVAGIALTAVYAPTGVLGGPLGELGIAAAYSRVGVVVALVFVGLPFAVRTIQPVLESLDPTIEHAAATLGATRWQTFYRVVLPALRPAALTGFTLAFARGVGEYGSVVFISGNMPMRTEIGPTLVMTKLEQFDLQGATALGLAMLVVSVALLLRLEAAAARDGRRRAA